MADITVGDIKKITIDVRKIVPGDIIELEEETMYPLMLE